MRIALVSPYSWTYPGGVTRHIEALAEQLLARRASRARPGALRSADRRSERLHRGAASAGARAARLRDPARAHARLPANGAVSNLARHADAACRRCAASCAPATSTSSTCTSRSRRSSSWDALEVRATPPLVGTFHTYSARTAVTNGVAANCSAPAGACSTACTCRIAVSEAAAWTARRFYGGRYRIVPNGVDAPAGRAPARAARPASRCGSLFVGQAVERKGLPVLLRAFEALREHVARRADDRRRRRRGGRAAAARRARRHRPRPRRRRREVARARARPTCSARRRSAARASAWCSPRRSPPGTPVVASDIAGYRDVVARRRATACSCPRGDADRARRDAARPRRSIPTGRAAMGAAAARARRALRLAAASPARSLGVYEDAIAAPRPRAARAAATPRGSRRRLALAGRPAARVPPRRLPSLEPPPPAAGAAARGRAAAARRSWPRVARRRR